jgi:uncharacterized Zn-finger protein
MTTATPHEIITVTSFRIACDGGGGPLGHPRVFMTMTKDDSVDCPYCGRHYMLDKNTHTTDAH